MDLLAPSMSVVGASVEPARTSESQVQSLGVCVAALCIWLEPFDIGTTPIENGEAAQSHFVLVLSFVSPQ